VHPTFSGIFRICVLFGVCTGADPFKIRQEFERIRYIDVSFVAAEGLGGSSDLGAPAHNHPEYLRSNATRLPKMLALMPAPQWHATAGGLSQRQPMPISTGKSPPTVLFPSEVSLRARLTINPKTQKIQVLFPKA